MCNAVIGKTLTSGRQEDAHEFMRLLLESMEDSYLTAVNGHKLDSRSKETTPLGQIFGGYYRDEGLYSRLSKHSFVCVCVCVCV